MLDYQQFADYIVFPTLHTLDLYSESAETLLIMTMAHESNGGTYLKQISGPALGIYQMEKRTFNDLWAYLNNMNSRHHHYAAKVMAACNLMKAPVAEEMIGNLYLATAMARLFYLRVKEAIPKDLQDLAHYCKNHWNTSLGKATPSDYLNAYYRFTGH